MTDEEYLGFVMGPENRRVFELLKLKDDRARQKHPVFAVGIYQGFGVIGEEYGEACQAVNHEQGEERIMDEAFDLLCVAWRFCRGDWRQKRGKNDGMGHGEHSHC
jgi:hypothetical protein